MSNEKKNKDYITGTNDSLNTAQDIIDSGASINGVPTNTGLFNTPINRTIARYNAPAGCKVIEHHGSYISMGQIPMGPTETSGYGAIGLPAETIDLVVGRGAALNKGKGPKKGEVLNNNHMSDSARIYICRLTDIDKDFNIESSLNDPRNTNKIARSAIAVKADEVRLIGREGIKIVTGKVFTPNGGEEKNSLGGTILPAPKIDLVAGNNYDNVQGIALGEKTIGCLTELNEIVGQLWSALFNLSLIQSGYNGVVATGTAPWVASAAVPANLGIYTKVLNSLYQTRTSATLWELNYLSALGKERIASTNVRAN